MIFKDKISVKLVIILLALISILAYSNSLKNSFIWDDRLVIVDNDFIKSWKNIPAIFTKAYLTPVSKMPYLGMYDIGSGETCYRPIVTVTYFFNYSIWQLNPFGYHFTNILLHIFNALLFYFLAALIIKDKKAAFLASLLFTLHPVNSEAVNVISFREDLLAGLFYLSSFILYIKLDSWKHRKKVYFYILSLILFMLALFSKEMALSLPLILVLYDYLFEGAGSFPTPHPEERSDEGSLKILRRYWGYIGVTLFYIWVRFFVINIPQASAGYIGGNFYTNFLTMARVVSNYIQWLFIPLNIAATLPDDPILISRSLFDVRVLISLVLIIAFFIIAIMIRKKSKEISFAIIWFFITLIPVSNILPITNYMAARYLYIPAIGFYLLLSMALGNLRSWTRYAVGITILTFYFIVTFISNFEWRDDITLWSGMVKKYPNNALAHSGLGASFMNKNLLDSAIGEYKTALSLDPMYAGDYDKLGVCYYKKGLLSEAEKAFKKAMDLDANLLSAYVNLGSLLGHKGLYEEAIVYFKVVLTREPRYVQAYDNLGVTYARMKQWVWARRMWNKALEINPGYKKAQDNLAKLRLLKNSTISDYND